MIIVQLQGGLGNQMFQYAAGRQLSIKHNVPLKFDLSFLNAEPENQIYTKRFFELDKFRMDAEIASEKEIRSIRRQKWKSILTPVFVTERKNSCYTRFCRAGKNSYLNGWFQSEKYFTGIAETIRSEFVFKKTVAGSEWAEIRNRIERSNSVSIHFRRGDYVENEITNRFHGVCSFNYYQQSIRAIAEKVENPCFFIFSDDIKWVKQNLKINFPVVFVEKKDDSIHSDFQLMTLCMHGIIANSSYSWWAAWLNSNRNKTVIAPQKWYADTRQQNKTVDLIPATWLRI